MKELKLNGRTYLSTKRAAEITGYTTDYVGQLARGSKVDAQLVGRNWYIEEESIKKHKFGEAAVVVKKSEEEVEAPALEVLVQDAEEADSELSKVGVEEVVDEPIISEDEKEDPVVAMESVWQEWYKAQRAVPSEEEEVFLTKSADTTEEEVQEEAEAPAAVPITRVREISRPIKEVVEDDEMKEDVQLKKTHVEQRPPVRSWGGAGLVGATVVTIVFVAGIATLAEIAMVQEIDYPMAAVYQSVRDYILGIQRI